MLLNCKIGMKRLIVILFVIFSINGFSQDLIPVSQVEKNEIVQTINKVAKKIITLKCDFEQVKHLSMLDDNMVSKGEMYYQQPNLLKWEYKTPYTYVFILNDTKVLLKSSVRDDIIDVRSSKIFGEISKIMVNSITGKGLLDDKNFNGTFFKNEEFWVVKLVPKRKEIKQMFNCIHLYFSKKHSVVTKVIMEEKTGDETTINLSKC
jgi:Outer membrane lipoprotein-sorting protein